MNSLCQYRRWSILKLLGDQLSAHMNTSQEASTSLSTEGCHYYYYTFEMELTVCIQCICREQNGFAIKRKWKTNLYLRVKPNFIVLGKGHELQTGIWAWKSEKKLMSSDWKVGATKIGNTLHRCLFQVTGWKYLEFCAPQKEEGASGWCPHFQTKSKYPWVGDACPSWDAVLQGSCSQVWLVASAREMCSLFCI